MNLELQLRAASLPQPETEYYFAKPRRWRFDYCWPSYKVALEVEGGAFIGGRHTRGKGFVNDLEKYRRPTAYGYYPSDVREAQHELETALSAVAVADDGNNGAGVITKGGVMEPKDISTEEWREYDFDGRVYRIQKPKRLYLGTSTHRVVDAEGLTHCVPAPGFQGCVLRWQAKPEVSF